MKRIIKLTESDLHRIVKRVILEQDVASAMASLGHSKLKDALSIYAEGKVENETTYIVFVAGTNTTGISHQKQYDAFLNSLGTPPANTEIKLFNYNEHQSSNSELFQFLKENLLNVEALVLFSAACSLGNELSPKYVPVQMTYCIEPWASDNNKSKWSNLHYGKNFYVNCCSWKRGKDAIPFEIPDGNINNFPDIPDGHIKALKHAVSKIF